MAPKIVIIDALSSSHVGNAALADSAVAQLEAEFPDAEVTILAFDPASIGALVDRKAIKTLWWEPFSPRRGGRLVKALRGLREGVWAVVNLLNFAVLRRLRLTVSPRFYTWSADKLAAVRACWDADIVVSISGEALQDALVGRMPFFLYGYLMAHHMGKVVAIFPQSIGPLEGRLSRWLAAYVLRRCDLVLPRDHASLSTVERLGVAPSRVSLIPDVVVNQRYVPSATARRLLSAEGVRFDTRPLIGMAVSKWSGADFDAYFPVMTRLGESVVRDLGGELVLFSPNMPYGDEPSDFEASRLLYRAMGNRGRTVLLKTAYCPSEFKGMLGELDVFVTTRMHSAILSTMIGTPTITIVTQPKLRGYMRMIGQDEWAVAVGDFTYERGREILARALAAADAIRDGLRAAHRDVGERSRRASRLLRQVYETRTGEAGRRRSTAQTGSSFVDDPEAS